MLQKQEIITDLIYKDQREIGLSLELDVTKVEMRIWQSFESAIEDQRKLTQDNQWLISQVYDLKFSMKKYQYEIKLLFSLSSIIFEETLYVK